MLCALLMAPVAATAGAAQTQQQQTPIPLKPGIPGTGSNHRLILKDGTYQMVRTYEIVGDRVRYLSLERGDWEELPASLVDWDATRKWEENHANPIDDSSPAMKEAAELDKEEAAERAAEKARTPEVAKGLELPDQDGVFVLDTYRGTPELVELVPTDLSRPGQSRHGISVLNPLAGARSGLELEGAHAKVHLHVNDPVFYLSLDTNDDNASNSDTVTYHAMTVNTGGAGDLANRKHGAQSPASVFVIVHVDERRVVRLMGAIRMDKNGMAAASDAVVATTAEVMPGKHWLKLTPKTTLLIGEYALVEVLSPNSINESVWDFRVDPTLGDNTGSMGPILQQ
jgi:hypothetical protein